MYSSLLLLSPFIFNGLLCATYFMFKNTNIYISPKYHNYNMALQSSVLLGITLYDYVSVSNTHNIPLTNFIQISHVGAYTHQQWNNYWILSVFLLSKLFEWIDTILLVINKKKIQALHWWHHSTIVWAFYTGFFISSVYTIGILNNIIHIVMYLYYADVKCIKPYAKYLTSLQIVQLFSGAYMNYLSYYNNDSSVYKLFSIFNGSICLSYGFMFLQFFNKKYGTQKTIRKINENKGKQIYSIA